MWCSVYMYVVAPLCYLTSKTELVYGLYKQMFMKSVHCN